MPFDHNDHYHRLLLRQIPNGARTALDVGCGHGRFAQRLGQCGLDVDAVWRRIRRLVFWRYLLVYRKPVG